MIIRVSRSVGNKVGSEGGVQRSSVKALLRVVFREDDVLLVLQVAGQLLHRVTAVGDLELSNLPGCFRGGQIPVGWVYLKLV